MKSIFYHFQEAFKCQKLSETQEPAFETFIVTILKMTQF